MKFKHPTVTTGGLSVGDRQFPIVRGVVDCDEAIGRDAGWTPIGEVEERAPVARPEKKGRS